MNIYSAEAKGREVYWHKWFKFPKLRVPLLYLKLVQVSSFPIPITWGLEQENANTLIIAIGISNKAFCIWQRSQVFCPPPCMD